MKYPPIPSVVFTLPPMARVGALEEEARQQGIELDVNLRRTANWYSSLRVRERYSACKVLVAKNTGRILGAHPKRHPFLEASPGRFPMAPEYDPEPSPYPGVQL